MICLMTKSSISLGNHAKHEEGLQVPWIVWFVCPTDLLEEYAHVSSGGTGAQG